MGVLVFCVRRFQCWLVGLVGIFFYFLIDDVDTTVKSLDSMGAVTWRFFRCVLSSLKNRLFYSLLLFSYFLVNFNARGPDLTPTPHFKDGPGDLSGHLYRVSLFCFVF